jgi:hypothetical protein
MTDTIKPIININGTDREDLLQQRLDILTACKALTDAVKQAAPNGRDYPGDPKAFGRDRDTHYARIAQLNALRSVILTEALALRDAAQ